MIPIDGAAVERFWNTITKTDGCWWWNGKKDKRGYGSMMIGCKRHRATRVSYQLAYGPVPEGLVVCHNCDNPNCVRPDHLWLGTKKQNSEDMVAKGRSATGKRNGMHTCPGRRRLSRLPGEKNPAAKLDWEKVRQIRAMRASGMKIAEIAKIFEVGKSIISGICTNKNWVEISTDPNQ